MKKRLRLVKQLLKPDGVFIVTIDEHEVHHLGNLLEEELREYSRQMVTIVINQKGVAQGRLSRVEEHAFFCFAPGAVIPAITERLGEFVWLRRTFFELKPLAKTPTRTKPSASSWTNR